MSMQYDRYLAKPLGGGGSRGKARLVLGARQTGKSTIFSMIRGSRDVLVDPQERSERPSLARDHAGEQHQLNEYE